MASALPTGPRGRAMALGLLAVVLGLVWLAAVSPLLAWHGERAERLEQRRTLAERMAGIAAALPELRRQAAGLPAAAPQSLLAGESDAVAGAALQTQLDRMAAQAGVALASAELLPAETAGAYRRISIRLTLGGAWPGLIGFLQGVAEAAPRMLVDDVQVQSSVSLAAGAAQPVRATLTVLAFRGGA